MQRLYKVYGQEYMGKNKIALHDVAKPASTTLTGFGFVQ